jgi:hypothetical protein
LFNRPGLFSWDFLSISALCGSSLSQISRGESSDSSIHLADPAFKETSEKLKKDALNSDFFRDLSKSRIIRDHPQSPGSLGPLFD